MFRKSFIISAVLFVMFVTACATVPQHTTANMMRRNSGSGYTMAIYRPAISPETAEMVQLAYQIQNFLIHDFKTYSDVSLIDTGTAGASADLQKASGINAQLKIIGELSYSDVEELYMVTLRGIDAQTGEILAYFSQKYTADEIRYQIATKEAVPKLFDGLSITLIEKARTDIAQTISAAERAIQRKEAAQQAGKRHYNRQPTADFHKKQTASTRQRKKSFSIDSWTLGIGYFSGSFRQQQPSLNYFKGIEKNRFCQSSLSMRGFQSRYLGLLSRSIGITMGFSGGMVFNEQPFMALKRNYVLALNTSIGFPFIVGNSSFGIGIGPAIGSTTVFSSNSGFVTDELCTGVMTHRGITAELGIGGSAVAYLNAGICSIHVGLDAFYNAASFTRYRHTVTGLPRSGVKKHTSVHFGGNRHSYILYPYIGIGLAF